MHEMFLRNAFDFYYLVEYRLRFSLWMGVTDRKRHELEMKLILIRSGIAPQDWWNGRCELLDWSSVSEVLAAEEDYSGSVVDAHYPVGKMYMMNGALNSAVYSFL